MNNKYSVIINLNNEENKKRIKIWCGVGWNKLLTRIRIVCRQKKMIKKIKNLEKIQCYVIKIILEK